jgi:hypothetical protein
VPPSSSASPGERDRGRFRAHQALILGLLLLGPPLRAWASGPLVLVRVSGAERQALPDTRIVARCPEGGRWEAAADANGFAVIANVPPCELSVDAVPERPDVRFRIDRLDARVVAVFSERLAGDLPSSGSAWSLLETAEPAAILDRINGAGLYLGEPGRFSMRGASWTQNALLLDGVDLTDPLRGGTPLAWPDSLRLERIEAVSGPAPVELAQPGVALALVSRAPARAWQGTVQGEAVSEGLQADLAPGEAPPIARFGSLAAAEAFLSGPLGSRLRARRSFSPRNAPAVGHQRAFLPAWRARRVQPPRLGAGRAPPVRRSGALLRRGADGDGGRARLAAALDARAERRDRLGLCRPLERALRATDGGTPRRPAGRAILRRPGG